LFFSRLKLGGRIISPSGRPFSIIDEGEVIEELF
jgi:hypothetical protein